MNNKKHILWVDDEVDLLKSHILEEVLVTYKNTKDFISIVENQKCNALIYGGGIDNIPANKDILTLLLSKPIDLILDAAAFSLFQENKNEFVNFLKERKLLLRL